MIPRPRAPRVRRSTIFLILVTAALAFPVGVWANHQFDDVPTAASYHDDVEALVNAGVTSGCDDSPPLYCPTATVTRAQMAQFLNRLGSLDGESDPSVNAATAESTDGFSIGCPSGTVWTQGICLETTPRSSATYFTANDTCAGLQGLFGTGWRYRLPLVGELRGARGLSGIALDASGEWADAIHNEGDTYYSITVTDAGVINQETTITSNVYRCAAIPLSIDFELIIIPFEEGAASYPEAPVYQPADVGADGAPSN
jgi:hypothetical protein